MPKPSNRSVAPLTRATSFGPLRDLLVEWEGERALRKAFHEENLPLAVIEHADLFVPTAALVAVFERAAVATGRRDFGFRVGERLHHHSYGLWLAYCVQAASLAEALQRVSATLPFHQSGSRLHVVRDGPCAVLRYERSRPRNGHKQHSDYAIPPLLSLLRAYLGKAWIPSWIELDYPQDADAVTVEALMPAPLRFARPALGLAIPANLMTTTRPHRITRPITLLDVEIADSLRIHQEPLRSIYAIAMLRLMDGMADVEGTSAMAGISVRTLQRHLNREGYSYRDLVERARLRRARDLLTQTDVTVTETALLLGYSEHANFTRAFRRTTGLSPAEFRRHMRRISVRKDTP